MNFTFVSSRTENDKRARISPLVVTLSWTWNIINSLLTKILNIGAWLKLAELWFLELILFLISILLLVLFTDLNGINVDIKVCSLFQIKLFYPEFLFLHGHLKVCVFSCSSVSFEEWGLWTREEVKGFIKSIRCPLVEADRHDHSHEGQTDSDHRTPYVYTPYTQSCFCVTAAHKTDNIML